MEEGDEGKVKEEQTQEQGWEEEAKEEQTQEQDWEEEAEKEQTQEQDWKEEAQEESPQEEDDACQSHSFSRSPGVCSRGAHWPDPQPKKWQRSFSSESGSSLPLSSGGAPRSIMSLLRADSS